MSLAGRIQNLSPKAKQYLILSGVGAAFLGLVMGGVSLWDSPSAMGSPAPETQRQTRNIVTPGGQVDPRDVWMAQSSQQMKEMDGVLQEMKRKLTEIEQRQSEPVAPPPPVQAQPQQSQPPQSILPPLPPLQPPGASTLPPPVAPPSPTATPGYPQTGVTPLPINNLPPPAAGYAPSGIAMFEVSAPAAKGTVATAGGNGQPDTYIPSGSFMRSVLLGGLDAPTGGQSQNNPWPVLLRAHDNAFLPNRYRAKVKECFLLGSGYGDISSERAYLRLESLSCVLNNGQVVDTEAKGYVAGEDGKTGLRGRLISKQGQVLAKALMAGVASGIGTAFQQSAMSYSTSAFGTVGTVDEGKQLQAGLGTGVGKALDRLSQYYIDLAEKLFPVIEVDAGRVVDVVLTKGITLALGPASDQGDYSEIWKRGRQVMRKPLNPLE